MPPSHIGRRLAPALALIALSALVGCGGRSTTTVTGKVTVKGKDPLPGGNITFILESDPSVVGGGVIKSDGTFEVLNAPVGVCKVVIDNTNLNASAKSSGMPGAGPGSMPGMMGAPKPPAAAGAGAPPKAAQERMGGPPKGADVPGEMGAEKDNGVKKYVKIDPTYTKPESTSLRHTVAAGENKGVSFDVK